jgi:hypothetical protein
MHTSTHRRASAKGEKYAQRLSRILALLHQNDTIDKHQLAQAFNVDVRAQGPHTTHVFVQLQNAIVQRYECQFAYKAKPRHAQPYRLIHKNGVWYLAAMEGGLLKNFSVALITELAVDEASRFTPDPAHQNYINRRWWCGNTDSYSPFSLTQSTITQYANHPFSAGPVCHWLRSVWHFSGCANYCAWIYTAYRRCAQ